MTQKRGKGFSIAVTAIVLLLIFAAALILKTYRDYTDEFIRQQEQHQLELTQSVDRNLAALLTQSRNSLEYIIHMEPFQKAEKQWLQSGKNGDILRYLTENHLEHNELIAGIAVLQDGKFIRDEHGRPTHQFINDDAGALERVCVGITGKYYLALLCQGQGNASYASMIDLQLLYEKISSIELAGSEQLLLLDRNSSLMLHYCADSEEVKLTLLENCVEREDFQLMLDAEETQQQGCFSFLYQTRNMDKAYNAHMMVLPTDMAENQNFAVGLVSNLDTALAPLQKASFHWVLGAGMLLAGICLLLLFVLHFRRRDIQIAKELELLQQKNIAMEELQRKTQEVAHHQRLELIGTLTSGVAHEFNNLLTPIMGYSMLTLEQLSPDQEELYDNVLEIYHTSRKAKEITSQLSQLSRKNNSGSKEYLNPQDLLDRVLSVAMPSCPEDLHIEYEQDSSKAKLYGNETQLSQLLLNLILNAFHAMEQGGTLNIKTELQHEQLLIHLTDSGCGMTQDVMNHIFEPFYTTKEGGKGSGLGLAIAKQIAEEHQGRIQVQSEEGRGSTFTLILPAYY